MDLNVKKTMEIKINKTMENLEKRGISSYLAQSYDQAKKIIEEITKEDKTISFGGTMTLFETGILDYLRSRKDIDLLDRYEEGLSPEDIKELYRKTFFADTFITSTNAITESGILYNVDGNGNRVAAMLYGPDKVIVLAGSNKIVKDELAAVKRVEELAAPINNIRLNTNNPCTKVGHCLDCSSPTRICKLYTSIKGQQKGRMHVIFFNENLGY